MKIIKELKPLNFFQKTKYKKDNKSIFLSIKMNSNIKEFTSTLYYSTMLDPCIQNSIIIVIFLYCLRIKVDPSRKKT